MILECIPYRNTKIGKECVERYDRLNRNNPINREYLIGRIRRVNSIIKKRLNEKE
jgi:hypothetical protein